MHGMGMGMPCMDSDDSSTGPPLPSRNQRKKKRKNKEKKNVRFSDDPAPSAVTLMPSQFPSDLNESTMGIFKMEGTPESDFRMMTSDRDESGFEMNLFEKKMI